MNKLIVFFGVIIASNSYSQEKLNPITKPDSPAAAILGMQPSVILQPKSYRALETSLYSNFSDGSGSGVVPNDFGLEFMHYWALNRGISLEDYLYPKTSFLQLVRNSSFSLASTQKFLLQDSTETKSIAFGYRTSLFFGNATDEKKVKKYIKEIRNKQEKNLDILHALDKIRDNDPTATKDDYVAELKKILPALIKKELKTKSDKELETLAEKIYTDIEEISFDKDKPLDFINSAIETVNKNVGGNYNEFKTYITNRHGMAVDFAAALLLNFPKNELNFSEVPKYSLWLTPSYNFSDNLDFLMMSATVRYEHYYKDYFEKYFPNSKVFDNNIDYGILASANFKKFAIELEATGRNNSSLMEVGVDGSGNTLYTKESSRDFQYIGTFSYRLTEQIIVSYQFGSAFKPVYSINGGTLISLLSLNLGFGGPDKNDINTTKE